MTALAIPATSRAAPGVAVRIPTLLSVVIRKAGVALGSVVVVLKSRAETPVSTTNDPVV